MTPKKFPVVKFPNKGKYNLTSSEKKVLEKLIQAAEAIAPIYAMQENRVNNGANFYPRDATKEEILHAAKKNREILSPYTIVERKKGKLITTPYHIKYKNDLQKVTKLIKEAAKLTDNQDFASRLKLQANALLDGSYEASDIYWLSLKPYKINFVIGPIERYEDKLFFKKCAYQAWVGVMDEDLTEDAIKFKNFIVSSRRKVLVHSEKVDFQDKTQIRVDDTIIFSGLIANFMFTSANLPNDVNLMEKYGSEVTIFKPSFDKKFEKEHYPIFQKVFHKKFQAPYTKAVLRKGSLRNSYVNEIGHSLLRYRDAERRLKEYFPIFDEISSSVFGVKSCGSLLLKDAISQKELEAIIIMFISRAFSWWLSYLKERSVIHYAQGFAVALNYFLESGAIREAEGFSWPNFTKIFVSLDELSDTLERILAVGTYEDAKNFVNKQASLEIFERFSAQLNRFI